MTFPDKSQDRGGDKLDDGREEVFTLEIFGFPIGDKEEQRPAIVWVLSWYSDL